MKKYFKKYLIIELNSRFVISDLNSLVLDDNDGFGYKTKNKAYHVIQNSLEKNLYPIKLKNHKRMWFKKFLK